MSTNSRVGFPLQPDHGLEGCRCDVEVGRDGKIPGIPDLECLGNRLLISDAEITATH
jgi:hypothetical protein